MLAVVALAASGCAAPATVGALQREISTVRGQLTEVRLAQDLVSADLARILAELRSLDARGADTQDALRESAAELARLRARLQATEDELREARAALAARSPLVTVPPATPATPAPAATPSAAQPPPVETDRGRGVVADEPADEAYAAALNTFRAREHGQAVLDFLDFIAKHPTHALAPHAQYWIGEAYYVQRDYRHALVELRRVLEMAPSSSRVADVLLRIGMCHANLGELAAATAAWQRVVRDHPRSDAAARARNLLRGGAAARRP